MSIPTRNGEGNGLSGIEGAVKERLMPKPY